MAGGYHIEDNGRDGTLIVNGCVTIDRESTDAAWADALFWIELCHNRRNRVADRHSSAAPCSEPGCDYAAGTACSYARCPGRRLAAPFHTSTTTDEGANNHGA